jgi:hypothetical protein
MAIAIRPPKPVAPTAIEITVPRVATEQVWQQLDSASFAVISYVTPARSADAETKRSWRASGGRLRERWRRKG